MAIHGFDFYSAEIVVSTIGDIHRFPDWRHLSSYVGLVPTVRNSGDTVHHGRITKRGSRDARWILSEVTGCRTDRRLVPVRSEDEWVYIRLPTTLQMKLW